MRMRSKINFPNEKISKFSLNTFKNKQNYIIDESLLDLSKPKFSFNYDMVDGTLKKGLGVKKFLNNNSFPQGVVPLKLYYYKHYNRVEFIGDDRIVAYCSDGYLYLLNLSKIEDGFTLIRGLSFDSAPKIVSYNYYNDDSLIISAGTKNYLYNDKEITEIIGAPLIRSMCIHHERLFIVSESDLGRTIWFSDDYNPTNWVIELDQAGYIEFADERGDVLKVVEFLDYVYIFRRYGIVRLSAGGDQTEFSLQNLNVNCGKIYGESVTVCGDVIIFMSSTGLYKFNGIDAVNILPSYDKHFESVNNENAEGVFYSGNLILKLKGEFDKIYKEVLLVYNLEKDSSYFISGLEVENFCLSTGEDYSLYTICDGEIVKFDNSGCKFNSPLLKVWESVKYSFNLPTTTKILKKIVVDSDERIVVIINADGKRHIYETRGENGEINLNVKAINFTFEIISKTFNPKISKPIFTIRYLKEKF